MPPTVLLSTRPGKKRGHLHTQVGFIPAEPPCGVKGGGFPNGKQTGQKQETQQQAAQLQCGRLKEEGTMQARHRDSL